MSFGEMYFKLINNFNFKTSTVYFHTMNHDLMENTYLCGILPFFPV